MPPSVTTSTRRSTPPSKRVLPASIGNLDDSHRFRSGKTTPGFVFAPEEERSERSSESSSTSSSEEEDDGEEDRIANRRPNKKKTKVEPKRKAVEEPVVQRAGLLEAFKRGKRGASAKEVAMEVAAGWTKRADSDEGVWEVLSLIVTASGGKFKDQETERAAKKKLVKSGAGAALDLALQSVEFAAGQGKQAEVKKVAEAMNAFFVEVGAGKNRDAERGALEACQAATKCADRDIRETGTVASMNLGLGLLTRAKALRKDLQRSRKMLEAEVASCVRRTSGDEDEFTKANKALTTSFDELLEYVGRRASSKEVQSQTNDDLVEDVSDVMLDALHEAAEAWRNAGRNTTLSNKAREIAIVCVRTSKELRSCERLTLEGRDSIFQNVLAHRFRDVDPNVRMAAIKCLGDWGEVYPEAICTSHRSKYLGWSLNDSNSAVRRECLESLIHIVEPAEEDDDEDEEETKTKKKSTKSKAALQWETRLVTFVTRFAPRVRDMFRDVDVSVTDAALRLTLAWLNVGLLTKDEDAETFQDAEECVFARFDHRAAPESITATETEAWESLREAASRVVCAVDPRFADESATPISKFRALLDLVARHVPLEEDWAHLEAEYAVGAFWIDAEIKSNGVSSFLIDTESICALLADDSICADAGSSRALATVLLYCARRMLESNIKSENPTTSSRAARGKKASSDSVQDVVARRLPDLMVKYRTDAFVLERLVRLIPLLSGGFESEASLEKLLREVVSVATQKSMDQLLIANAQALATLCDDKRSESRKARLALNKACEIISTELKSNSDYEESKPWMARASALACSTDAGAYAFGGEDQIMHVLMECKRTQNSEWLVYGLKCLLGASAWSSVKATQDQESTSSESFASAKRNRDFLVEALKSSLDSISSPAATLAVLEMIHDARTVFWPGVPLLGWSPSNDFLKKTDSMLKDQVLDGLETALERVGDSQGDAHLSQDNIKVSGKDALIQCICESALLPESRSALFAASREEIFTGTRVLRQIASEENSFRNCASKLNTELRRSDVDRWAQIHLETLALDPTLSADLYKALGPSSVKAAQSVAKAVSRMLCRALRVACEAKDDAALNAVAPYIKFCKVGDSHDRVTQTWDETCGKLRKENEDMAEFASEFEALLLRPKRGANADSPEKLSPVLAGKKKKAKPSSTGMKRGRRAIAAATANEDFDEEDEPTPKRSAAPLKFVSKRTSSAAAAATTVAEADEEDFEEDDDEKTHLERSVFIKKSGSSQKPVQMIGTFDDDVPSARRAAAKSKVDAQRGEKAEDRVEDSDQEEEDDDDEVIGFRPRTTWS